MKQKYEYSKIGKNCLILILGILLFYFGIKLSMFYMPFLIGYIISILIEPMIRFLKNKTNISRKTSSIIVLVLVFVILIAIMSWGVITLINEMSNFLGGINIYFEKIINLTQYIWKWLGQFNLPEDINYLLQNSVTEIFSELSNLLKNYMSKILQSVSSIPKVFIYTIITILATYFISSDKFYILDRMEHHIPKKWVGKFRTHLSEIISALGNYLKAEIILILITFIVVTIGLNLFYVIGMRIEYPFLMALFIGFIDALPILGAGTVFVPWIIIEFLNSNNSLASCLLGLYILIIVLRQILEPKLVSNKIGIHPIFTLIAMYTGFKLIGILGMLIGPVALVILKNIFANSIDTGLVKWIIE